MVSETTVSNERRTCSSPALPSKELVVITQKRAAEIILGT
jgi:hypothetical protein